MIELIHFKKIYKLQKIKSYPWYLNSKFYDFKFEYSLACKYMIMMMIICIHKKDTLQITATNKQQTPNLRMPVESNKKHIYLIIN